MEEKEMFAFRMPKEMISSEAVNVLVQIKFDKPEYYKIKKMALSSGLKINSLIKNIVQDYIKYYDNRIGNA
jgi:hypothetical protein